MPAALSDNAAMALVPSDASTADAAAIQSLLDEFHRLESQLQQVRQGLAHSHRLATLGTMAATVAHEFNNILTPLISYAQFALTQPPDLNLMRSALEKVYAGSQHAARICTSLLGFTRQQLPERTAPLLQTVRDAMGCLGRDPASDRIEVKVDLPDLRVAMAPIALQQVFVNLFLNARKAMLAAGGMLTITATAADGRIDITVADTGPGIPPAIRDRLFEPFVSQPAGPAPAAAQGTGLGLWISRDLLRAAGGELELDTTPRRGASFRLSIPAATELPETT